MARGAQDALDCGIAVSVTGIAGPDGGSEKKPVGTVYIAVSSECGARGVRLSLGEAGGRQQIREAAVAAMLRLAKAEADRILPF